MDITKGFFCNLWCGIKAQNQWTYLQVCFFSLFFFFCSENYGLKKKTSKKFFTWPASPSSTVLVLAPNWSIMNKPAINIIGLKASITKVNFQLLANETAREPITETTVLATNPSWIPVAYRRGIKLGDWDTFCFEKGKKGVTEDAISNLLPELRRLLKLISCI